MNASRKSRALALAGGGLLLGIAVAGCVAYRGDRIPRIDPATISVPRMQRVFAFDSSVHSNVGGEFEVNKVAESELESTLRLAGADLRPSGAVANPDGTLSTVFTANGDAAGQMLSGFVSGVTFLVVPGYANVDLALDATYTARGGDRKTYHYADSYTLWIQIFLLPFTNSPDAVLKELIGDMSRSLARDMQRDGLLPTASTESVPAAPRS